MSVIMVVPIQLSIHKACHTERSILFKKLFKLTKKRKINIFLQL